MPLIQSGSKEAVSKNISEFHTGKTYARTAAKFGKAKADKQAIAVALDTARRAKRAVGGMTPWTTKLEARGLTHQGPIKSIIPGRTDKHPMNVGSGSYVVPADVVSHLGQNNTQAGMAKLGAMFGKTPAIKHGSLPRPPAMQKAKGGAVGKPTPIIAAGGEYVIPPEVVADIGGGDVDLGHKVLDSWVLKVRKQHIKTLQKLPGPAKT